MVPRSLGRIMQGGHVPEKAESSDPSPIQDGIEDALGSFSQRISRRGLLAKTGKVLLGALGVQAIQEIVPAYQEEAAASHGGPTGPGCRDWTLCGLYGAKCRCSGCSGGTFKGPNCARRGYRWTMCCPGPSGRRVIYYWDWYQGNCSNARRRRCHACRHWCYRGKRRGYYRGSGPWYMCTQVVVSANLC